jgi:hypothetical protein
MIASSLNDSENRKSNIFNIFIYITIIVFLIALVLLVMYPSFVTLVLFGVTVIPVIFIFKDYARRKREPPK